MMQQGDKSCKSKNPLGEQHKQASEIVERMQQLEKENKDLWELVQGLQTIINTIHGDVLASPKASERR